MDDITYCEPGRIFCRSKKVMLAVDGSEGAARAATVAFEITELTGSTLHIVHVIPKPSVHQISLISGTEFSVLMQKYRENGITLLQGYTNEGQKYNLEVVISLEEGLPSDRLASYSREHDIDIIVIGSTGLSGIKESALGSATERVIRGAKCPVLVVK
ncbi:MAG: universal stress protein [Candidatus Thorarchaeota archaeon]